MRTQTLALGAAWLGVLGLACGPSGGSGGKAPFRVSGKMSVAANTSADGDTNDPFSPFFDPNDSAPSAQELPNPVTLGGHVNVAGAFPADGEPGRTTAAGDPEDWFRVSIAAGQLVRLNLAEDGNTNDLSLELLRLDQTPVAISDGSTRSEEIQVATSGDYLVLVTAQSGFSNYSLSIGQPNPGVTRAPDFVPGQVVLRARPGAAAGAPALRAAALGMRAVAGVDGAPQLYDFSEPAQHAAALQALGLAPVAPLRSIEGGRSDEAALREDTRRVVEALRQRSDIESADLNYLRQPSAVPTDRFYPLQWHYEQIDLPAAWDGVMPNSGVVVAVVDTGVVLDHPDLLTQLVPGYDFIQNQRTANDGNGCDANPDDPGDMGPGGNSYHGTHVAGTVAAATSLQPGGNEVGVAGVAWNARVMPLRVLGVGGGTDFDIMQSLLHAAGRPNACSNGAAAAVGIVNMSLGGPGFSQTFQNLLLDLRNTEGLIFVAAAGNESTTQLSYPAAYDGVVSVSATGPREGLAPYSNRGSSIDVAGPGGDFAQDADGDGYPDGVLSTLFDDEQGDFVYSFYQGTSMASPHVAGVFALMLGVNPDITPDDIDSWLAARPRLLTRNIGPANSFGHGLIDAALAVETASTQAGGGSARQAVLRLDPDSLNFGLLAKRFSISASNSGGESAPLAVGVVEAFTDSGGPWLSVQPSSVDSAGLGDYRVQVDRSGLSDGIYTGSLSFDSDANDVDVPVIVRVGDINALVDPSAGHHYVLLIDPESFETVAQLEADPQRGVYAFRFDDVDEGTYLVVAGTDSDNDFLICDRGEACGAFPTTELAEELSVDRNQKLRFVTGFDTAFSGASGDAERRGYRRLR